MSDLSLIFHEKLIPWARQDAAGRCIVAQPEMNPEQLPPDVQLVPRPISGERTIVKNLRQYNNTRGISARWQEEGLNETRKYKIGCVLEGYIDYQLGTHKLQCGPGHFLFIPPGTPHPDGSRSYLDTTKSASCKMMFFMLHSNALECWITEFEEQKRRQTHKTLLSHERIVQLFQILTQEISAHDNGITLLAESLLPVCFLALQQEIDAGRYQPIRTRNSFSPDDLAPSQVFSGDFAAQLDKYIKSNLQKGLTMEEAARDMYLSRAQFARKVRRETGYTFNELLTQHRMEEAQKLLSSSPWTVTAISYFLGFKSSSYFRTFFLKHAGQTPTEYRENAPSRK